MPFLSVLQPIEPTERHAHSPTHIHRWAFEKYKTQIKTKNTKLKSVKRGRVIFKFDDVGPRPSGLKGCAIRRSRANAVLMCRIRSPIRVSLVGRIMAREARRAPANSLERAGTVFCVSEKSGSSFEKN